jgi:hypothetical protein
MAVGKKFISYAEIVKPLPPTFDMDFINVTGTALPPINHKFEAGGRTWTVGWVSARGGKVMIYSPVLAKKPATSVVRQRKAAATA